MSKWKSDPRKSRLPLAIVGGALAIALILSGCSQRGGGAAQQSPAADSSISATPEAADQPATVLHTSISSGTVKIANADGYTANLVVNFKLGLWVKSVVNDKPGFASAKATSEMDAELYNTTSGRTTTVNGTTFAVALYPSSSQACELTLATGVVGTGDRNTTVDGKYCLKDMDGMALSTTMEQGVGFKAPHLSTDILSGIALDGQREDQLDSMESVVDKPYAVVIILSSVDNRSTSSDYRPDWQVVGGSACQLKTKQLSDRATTSIIAASKGFSCGDL